MLHMICTSRVKADRMYYQVRMCVVSCIYMYITCLLQIVIFVENSIENNTIIFLLDLQL